MAPVERLKKVEQSIYDKTRLSFFSRTDAVSSRWSWKKRKQLKDLTRAEAIGMLVTRLETQKSRERTLVDLSTSVSGEATVSEFPSELSSSVSSNDFNRSDWPDEALPGYSTASELLQQDLLVRQVLGLCLSADFAPAAKREIRHEHNLLASDIASKVGAAGRMDALDVSVRVREWVTKTVVVEAGEVATAHSTPGSAGCLRQGNIRAVSGENEALRVSEGGRFFDTREVIGENNFPRIDKTTPTRSWRKSIGGSSPLGSFFPKQVALMRASRLLGTFWVEHSSHPLLPHAVRVHFSTVLPRTTSRVVLTRFVHADADAGGAALATRCTAVLYKSPPRHCKQGADMRRVQCCSVAVPASATLPRSTRQQTNCRRTSRSAALGSLRLSPVALTV